jgi:hypothetical protein
MKVTTRITAAAFSLVIAAALWLPLLHLFFKADVSDYYCDEGIAPKARELAAEQLMLWTDPAQRADAIARMRASNAEWDFMGRTYLVLSLANMALREPAKKTQYLDIMDRIIDETVRLEKEEGIYHFLMPYARTGHFISSSKRSIFQDGEIALMLAARRLVEEKEEYRPLLTDRVETMTAQMKESPVLCGESYPDECWMFCNSVALAAIRIADVLDDSDHSEFMEQWIETAKKELVHKETGLLISYCSFGGSPYDGPEGSSIWMIAHCLQIVDPQFAQDQYGRAKAELAGRTLGFGYAREWPESWKNPADVDSGPIIPLLEISAGSSGLAFVAASAFNDREYLSGLLTSLNYGGFPVRKKGRLRYCASNQVGDAVLLYSMVLGPLWDEVTGREQEEHEKVPEDS